MASNERKPWHAIFRLLERDERVFAVLLAVVMVGGLATLGLAPLRPRYRFDVFSLVQWFAFYKAGRPTSPIRITTAVHAASGGASHAAVQ